MLLDGKNAVISGARARSAARSPGPSSARGRSSSSPGGTQVAFEALESIRRQLSAELGPAGIRVVTLRAGGVPTSLPEDQIRRGDHRGIVKQTMLGRAATLEDVGSVAAFVASDRARTMTAATANVSCGALVD
jgi:3-oxoacyl-[acyl-carrier protein] reductase